MGIVISIQAKLLGLKLTTKEKPQLKNAMSATSQNSQIGAKICKNSVNYACQSCSE